MADNTPITPAPETAEEPVEFSSAQQKKIELIVKEVSARAGADARAEAERLRKEVEALKAATPVTPDLSKDLELSRAELKALKAAQSESQLTEQLRQAAGDMFLDTSLAVRLMKDSVKIGADGKPIVVDEQGNPALGSDFQPLSLAGLAERIADQKKFLARGVVKRGAGSTPGGGAPANAGPRLADLFGPKSNGGLANALALRSPSEYTRLKNLAREKGLLR